VKRSEIKRTSPLKRKKSIARGGYIKHKRAKYPSRIEEQRRIDWQRKQSKCHICRTARGVETHHIALRTFASDNWERACNWLWICRKCHRWLHDTGGNRHAWLLEVKRVADPSNYSLSEWLDMTKKTAEYLTSEAANK